MEKYNSNINSSHICVSVIVPVYNAGIYLQRCLDSLVNQTLTAIEIIAVLDCPTDGSDKIVEAYAAKDSRIIVIKNEQNIHIGHSRNKGLEVAKGKYIGFSDHDDYMELTMFQQLYQKAEEGYYDLVCCSRADIQRNTIIPHIYPSPQKTDTYDIEEFRKAVIGRIPDDITHKNRLSAAVWNKLFRRDIITNNDIQFIDTKTHTGEDIAFVTEYALHAKSVGLVQNLLYYHVYWGGNTINAFTYRTPQNNIHLLDYINKLLQRHHMFEKYKYQYYDFVQHIILGTMGFYLKKKKVLLCIQSIFYFRKYSFVRKAFRYSEITITNPSKVKLIAARIGKLLYK
jgi:glycosyltransferase involved in cell wall biosynthesis